MNGINIILNSANIVFLGYGYYNKSYLSGEETTRLYKITVPNVLVLLLDVVPLRRVYYLKSYLSLCLLSKLSCLFYLHGIYGPAFLFSLFGENYIKLIPPQKFTNTDYDRFVNISKDLIKQEDLEVKQIKELSNKIKSDQVSRIIEEKRRMELMKYNLSDPISKLCCENENFAFYSSCGFLALTSSLLVI